MTTSPRLTVLLLGSLLLFHGCRQKETVEPVVEPGFFHFLAKTLADSLTTKDVGYGFAIYEGASLRLAGGGGPKSRLGEPEGPRDFTENTRMHIASLSKTITAMAFLKLAAEKGLRTTDPIGPYLPPSWPRGELINQITFRELLTHRSGIVGAGDDCRNGSYGENIYFGLKTLVGKGVKAARKGAYCYQNANFGLFRVLIPALLGYKFTGNEVVDDNQTQQQYRQYVQQNVLDKVGIGPAAAGPVTGDPTYTYDYPYSGRKGWNPGRFENVLGGYGWYLSAAQAGQLYATVLSSPNESVLPAAWKDTLLTRNLGCFKATGVEGAITYHDGWWYLNANGYQGLRTIWMKFPQNLTVVLFVNSLNQKNGLFPSNSGSDITAYLFQAYNRARQLSSGRKHSPEPEIEHPEPH